MDIPEEITHAGPLVRQVMRIHIRLTELAGQIHVPPEELHEELAWILGGGIDPWAFAREVEYALAAEVLEEVADTLEETVVMEFDRPNEPCEGRHRRRRR